MTKVCFTKSTVHVKRMVNFGIVGEREVSIDLAHSEFPRSIRFEANAVKPIFNGDVLIAIEFDISDALIDPVSTKPWPDSNHYATGRVEKSLNTIGQVQSPRVHKPYTILQSGHNGYYIRNEFGSQHLVRRTVNGQNFQTILAWLRKQPLPATYGALEAKIRAERVAKCSYFWDFMIIAMCKWIIKATVKNHETILYFY